MPTATRFITRIQDADDYAEDHAWAGGATFGDTVTVQSGGLQAVGSGYPLTGEGVEIFYVPGDSRGYLRVMDHDTAYRKQLYFSALDYVWWCGAFGTMVLDGDGRLGLGLDSPEVPLELASQTPYFTRWNWTHEDADGGRESRSIFKGEQSGGEKSTLAMVEVSHDGAGDDQKGKWVLFVNDGSDGDSPTERLRVNSTGAMLLAGSLGLGGIAVPGARLDIKSSAPSTFVTRWLNSDADNLGGVLESGANAGYFLLYDASALKVMIHTAANSYFNGGNVGFGITVPLAQVHIDQSSATGAKPAVTLDQADVDQPLTKLIGSADAASANRTFVAASDFTTPGALVGWEKVNVQDDGNRITDGDLYRPLYAMPTA